MIYSFFGWVYESSFTTLRDGRWQNRGFLYGPCCPIYGVGAVLITQIAEKVGSMQNEPMPLWSIFLVSFVGSAVLEYVTSYTLEKLFHAIWWDYSMLPFNLNGWISLLNMCGGRTIFCMIFDPKISELKATKEPSEKAHRRAFYHQIKLSIVSL